MRRYARQLTWLLISTCLFFAIAQTALQQRQAPLSKRHILYSIPAAVSMLRGYAHDYTAQMVLAEPFVHQPEEDTNAQIKQQMAMPITKDTRIQFVSGDDKGLIDLTYAAFVVFGPTTDSITKAIVSLIGLSIFFFSGIQRR
jgi:hypothetical protein